MTGQQVLDRRRVELSRAAEAARAVAEHLTTLAAGASRAAAGIPDVTGWQGRAAVAATAGLNRRQSRLQQVAKAFGAAAGAAREHSAALSQAAAQLGPAIGPAASAMAGPAVALARAEATATESGRRCAGVLASLAATAPPRRSRTWQDVARSDRWTTHFVVGAVEGLAGLGMLGVSAATVPIGLRHRDGVFDLGDLFDVVRDPGELARAVLDLDTWRDDPARALGHLAPDVVAGAFGAGGAAAGRSRRIALLDRNASAAAAYRQQSVLATREVTAAGARNRLIRRSLDDGTRLALGPRSRPWNHGPSHLDRLTNSQVTAFHRLNAAGEPELTRRMQRVAAQVDVRLAHLETRLKSVDSLRRKVADGDGELVKRLGRADDVVRYTLVFDGPRYTLAAHRVAELLTADGLHLDRIWQAWDAPKVAYRGINSVWVDPRTGVKLEVQFHTPASDEATIRTHPQYEEKRAKGVSQQRIAELNAEMRAVYDTADPPPAVLSIEKKTLIPLPPPDPFVPPPDVALAVAVLAGAGAGAAVRSRP